MTGLRWLPRWIALIALMCVSVGGELPTAWAQSAEAVDALNRQTSQLYDQGKYAEATDIAKRALALAEQALIPDHPSVGTALNNLAVLYRSQGLYAEVEPLLKRSLAQREKTLGPDHLDVALQLNNLASLYSSQARHAEAELLYQRSLAIREKAVGPDHPLVAATLSSLAGLHKNQGRYADAERLYQRSLAIREKVLGPDHPEVGWALGNLALLYQSQGRYAEAEPLSKRDLSIAEKTLGPDHPDLGTSLNNLADLYRNQGRYSEAEPLYRRSLALKEKTLGPEHFSVATTLNNLAILYERQGREAEAVPLFQRALAINEKSLGPDHPSVATTLNNLAVLYKGQGRYAEAVPLYQRSLALREKALGPDHPDIGQSLSNLAGLHESQGRYAEAEPLYQRSLALREKALGPDHPDVANSLSNLAGLYESQGRYAEAESLYQRSLALYEKALGPDHPDVGTVLGNLAVFYLAQQKWARAADAWRRSTDQILRRAQRGTDVAGKSEVDQLRGRFRGLIKVLYRLASEQGATPAALLRETFTTAQWALGSQAAASLAKMTARGAASDPGLVTIVRERQDLVADWQKLDGLRMAAVSQAPERRNRAAEAANVARLAAIDTRIAAIDKRLAADFPDYAALSRSDPLSVEEVQSQLRPDEALVLVLDTTEWKSTPEETFIWVVTKSDMRWVRSDLGEVGIFREAVTLRCGLDAALWDNEVATTHCRRLLGGEPQRDIFSNLRIETLPFSVTHAHGLYKALFGQVEDLIRGKHLLIVPSGPLTQIPFQVLVTEDVRPAGASISEVDYRATAWLARKHAITVLPAVSSLKALRRLARPSAATKPMVGFGNPLLEGDPSERPWEAEWAKLARQKQACPQTPWQRVAGAVGRRRGVAPMPARNGHADLDHLRGQAPLHDTADELCAVAKDLKLAPQDILLGAKATETTIKRLSAEGKLADYRVLHFATHGTLAGEIEGTSEPGLILTPPNEQTETDDGYLSASEVAALKLDADWVILSACNTAAGGAKGGEALSGLARAFLYAGARALLVSHWSVNSAATVKLVTSAVGTITRDSKIGRAEALRQAMLAMIDKGEAHQAHPAFWAPFVVVGEGAAR